MKKPLFTIICFLFVIQALHSQYQSMFEDGATWNSYYAGLAFGNTRLIVEGDSLINGKLYKVVNYYENQNSNSSYQEYFREDTITKQVFQHYPRIDTDTIELLTFDFSLLAGDTVTVYDEPTIEYTLVLDSISSIIPYDCPDCEMPPEVYIDSPRVFYLRLIDCVGCGPVIWLEGVGGLSFPLYSISGIPRSGLFDEETLLCHYSGMDVLDYRFFYPEEIFPCFGPLVSIDELKIEDRVEVYPNPSTGILTIQSEQAVQKIEIYDLYGRLHQINGPTVPNELDLSRFSDGLLIFRITTRDGQMHIKRIVKK